MDAPTTASLSAQTDNKAQIFQVKAKRDVLANAIKKCRSEVSLSIFINGNTYIHI
jgi:hypothetical protein